MGEGQAQQELREGAAMAENALRLRRTPMEALPSAIHPCAPTPLLDMSAATVAVGSKFTRFGRLQAGEQNMWHVAGLRHCAHEVE